MAMITPVRLKISRSGWSIRPIARNASLTIPFSCSSTTQAARRASSEVQNGSSSKTIKIAAMRSEALASR